MSVTIETPQQRRSLIDIVWQRAMAEVEGPDYRGEGVSPDACWEIFTKSLEALGLELDLRQIENAA